MGLSVSFSHFVINFIQTTGLGFVSLVTLLYLHCVHDGLVKCIILNKLDLFFQHAIPTYFTFSIIISNPKSCFQSQSKVLKLLI